MLPLKNKNHTILDILKRKIECIIVILYSVYQLNCNLYTFIDNLKSLF